MAELTTSTTPAGGSGNPGSPGAEGPAHAHLEADPTEVFAAFVDAGLWPGLGRTTGGRLPAAGITTAGQVDPGSLTRVEGVTAARARRLAETFANNAPTFAVAELLVPAGLPARLARKATAELGPTAAARIRADPWRLLDGGEADIAQADRLARHFGARREDPRRGPAVFTFLLNRVARSGDTASPAQALLRAGAREGVVDPVASLTEAVNDGRVIAADAADDGTGDRMVALERYARAEESVAEGVARLDATAQPLVARSSGTQRPGAGSGSGATADGSGSDTAGRTGSDTAGSTIANPPDALDEAQRSAVAVALEAGVSLLTGGPGTGKSRTVAALLVAAKAANARVALAAPTGRAAKRLEELTGHSASTLHRLLQAQGADGGFARDEDNPLEADLVVVDETSMLDAELAAALLDACADGTHLLLVGDPAQLPSIGAGRVLGDLIDSKAVPVTELRTLYRQADGGAIARLAIAVREGDLPPPPTGPDREVVVVTARGSGEAAHRTVQLVTDSIPRALGIPSDQVQVVTPVHKGPAGTIALNQALKKVLNPGPGAAFGFDVGDRIVATANHIDEGFANGEIGVVVAIGEKSTLKIAFSAGPVDVPANAISDLRHGWALTAHRAQGSEWPAVVVVVPSEGTGMLSRPLVYTALTRAQSHLSVVTAVGPTLRRAVREVGGRRRCTLLPSMLAAEGLGVDGTSNVDGAGEQGAGDLGADAVGTGPSSA
jgi:exodeoxyribonuclease-5/exodeoxyribonuclease V alpha subunit